MYCDINPFPSIRANRQIRRAARSASRVPALLNLGARLGIGLYCPTTRRGTLVLRDCGTQISRPPESPSQLHGPRGGGGCPTGAICPRWPPISQLSCPRGMVSWGPPLGYITHRTRDRLITSPPTLVCARPRCMDVGLFLRRYHDSAAPRETPTSDSSCGALLEMHQGLGSTGSWSFCCRLDGAAGSQPQCRAARRHFPHRFFVIFLSSSRLSRHPRARAPCDAASCHAMRSSDPDLDRHRDDCGGPSNESEL